MCGGVGSILGAVVGAGLAIATGGAAAPLVGLLGATGAGVAAGVGGAALGALAGDTMVDKPQKQMQQAMEDQNNAAQTAINAAQEQAAQATQANQDMIASFTNQQNNQAKQTSAQAQLNQPDYAARLYKGNKQREVGQGGVSTMLTGPQGVDTSSLNLGKNTLLGG